MTVLLATICLNELEHLANLYEQHRCWPEMTAWVVVESADRIFALTNPDMVSKSGLSVDGTTEYLTDLAKKDSRIRYIPFGFCSAADPAQGKVQARQKYLDVAEDLHPDFVYVLDADEMYSHKDQARINHCMEQDKDHLGFVFKQRHIWRPQSITNRPLMDLEVQGGYWSVPHARGWRWQPGMRYQQNHNWPEDEHGRLFNRPGCLARFDLQPGTPECIHLGFASSLKSRASKHKYYVARGEDISRRRYVDCRQAFEVWKPGNPLPHGARVIKYSGVVPEVFVCKASS